METILYLVRHGETEWNRSGRWQGHADVPLSEGGRQQARALADRLRAERVPVEHVYTSDLSRAAETATIVADALGLEAVPLRELREIDVGGWSGLTRAEITERFPGAFQTVFHAPDGETHAAFEQRIVDAVLGLVEQHPGGRVLLVTHGGTVRALLGYVYRRQGRGGESVPFIGNTSLTELRSDDSGWQVAGVNDIAHVAGEQQAPDVLASSNEQGEPKVRILVLVPDLMFSVRIVDAARAQGLESREVASGAALLSEARAGAAAVVVDTQTRGDWLDAVKQLKADPATAAIPILAFGSHVDVAAQRAAVEAGVDRLVTRGKLAAELPTLLRGLVAATNKHE